MYFPLDPRLPRLRPGVHLAAITRDYGVGDNSAGADGVWFLQDLGKELGLMSSSSGSSSQGNGECNKVAEEEKGSGRENALLQRRWVKKTLGASRMATRVDDTVTTTELEYEVVDLERLLPMATQTRKDKDKARKDRGVGRMPLLYYGAQLPPSRNMRPQLAPTRTSHGLSLPCGGGREVLRILRRWRSRDGYEVAGLVFRRVRVGGERVARVRARRRWPSEWHKHKHEKDGPPPNNPSHGPCTPLWFRTPASLRTTTPPPVFGPEFKEHLHGAKSAKVRERMERQEGEGWGGGGGGGGSGGWRSSAEVGPGGASGEFAMGKGGGRDEFHARRPFSTSPEGRVQLEGRGSAVARWLSGTRRPSSALRTLNQGPALRGCLSQIYRQGSLNPNLLDEPNDTDDVQSPSAIRLFANSSSVEILANLREEIGFWLLDLAARKPDHITCPIVILTGP
ncbi:hypothetical protein FIBSPDRAFT_899940 [Athelia psychrophila]|uniref:Uncharacterized protein n=1 Tax=Athelia psychrophila TaxID=1759441 RepID=A0A165Z2G1_9AGAM|nr:hypothetical protein FIBSPDRAFT_899940 [Fibularhizoctonia sp. CBS 109695]